MLSTAEIMTMTMMMMLAFLTFYDSIVNAAFRFTTFMTFMTITKHIGKMCCDTVVT